MKSENPEILAIFSEIERVKFELQVLKSGVKEVSDKVDILIGIDSVDWGEKELEHWEEGDLS